jgi:hypothetical protein
MLSVQTNADLSLGLAPVASAMNHFRNSGDPVSTDAKTSVSRSSAQPKRYRVMASNRLSAARGTAQGYTSSASSGNARKSRIDFVVTTVG